VFSHGGGSEAVRGKGKQRRDQGRREKTSRTARRSGRNSSIAPTALGRGRDFNSHKASPSKNH
jgi:hypothetical protein